jgi:hypothetical protein
LLRRDLHVVLGKALVVLTQPAQHGWLPYAHPEQVAVKVVGQADGLVRHPSISFALVLHRRGGCRAACVSRVLGGHMPKRNEVSGVRRTLTSYPARTTANEPASATAISRRRR